MTSEKRSFLKNEIEWGISMLIKWFVYLRWRPKKLNICWVYIIPCRTVLETYANWLLGKLYCSASKVSFTNPRGFDFRIRLHSINPSIQPTTTDLLQLTDVMSFPTTVNPFEEKGKDCACSVRYIHSRQFDWRVIRTSGHIKIPACFVSNTKKRNLCSSLG